MSLKCEKSRLSAGVLTLLTFVFFFSASATLQDLKRCLFSGGVTNITALENGIAYEALLNFSLQNRRYAEKWVPKPALIVVPEKAAEVPVTVTCCVKYGWLMRIRCGGHSYEAHSSWADSPFVIVDFMQLQRVHVNISDETAWVEGGATLGQLYAAIAAVSNVHAFPAGTCPTVGVSGQIAGGGYGMLTRKYGLASDHVLDALLVDAKGNVLDRKAMGEDVFWALCGGGGGSFGVVLAWKVGLVRVPLSVVVFSVERYGDTDKMAEIMHKWQLFAPFTDDNLTLRADLKGNSSERWVNLYALFLGNTTELLELTNRGFPELNLTEDEVSEMSFIESVEYFGIFFTSGSLVDRYYPGKGPWKATSDLTVDIMPSAGILGLWDMLGVKNGSDVLFTPLGGVMNRTPDDASPFPYRAGYLTIIHYGLFWNEGDGTPAEDEPYVSYVRAVRAWLAPYVSANPRGAYVNYLDLDLGFARNGTATVDEGRRQWGGSYFRYNYERLVKAKTVIDPSNVFRHSQSIPPATS